MATNTDKIFFSILIGIIFISIFFTKPNKLPDIDINENFYANTRYF